MISVFKREVRSYFNNMTGYAVLAGTLFLVALYVYSTNFTSGYPNFEFALDASTGFLFTLIIPLLTMKTFAEERKQKTDQLLLTSPLSVPQVVLGKYFGTLAVFGIATAIMCIYPPVLSIMGNVNFKTAYSGILGLLFIAAALCAVGMFISSLTENPLISAVITVCVMLLLSSLGLIISYIPVSAKVNYIIFTIIAVLVVLALYALTKNFYIAAGFAVVSEGTLIVLFKLFPETLEGSVSKLLTNIALFDKMSTLVNGMLDIGTLVYYAGIAALFVFFTVLSVEKRRWN